MGSFRGSKEIIKVASLPLQLLSSPLYEASGGQAEAGESLWEWKLLLLASQARATGRLRTRSWQLRRGGQGCGFCSTLSSLNSRAEGQTRIQGRSPGGCREKRNPLKAPMAEKEERKEVRDIPHTEAILPP